MEDSSILGWTDATVTPESGQATTITIRDDTGAIVTTIDGLTGTSYDLPLTAFGTHAICDVTLTSKRDGLASIQGHTIRVKVATSTVTPSAPGAGTENGGYTVPTGTTMPAFQE